MDEASLAKARRQLIAKIEEEARETQFWTGRAHYSERVMTALEKVPRHEFVLPEDQPYAYVNRPRGIGHGQTISQPYIVALMTDLLDLEPTHRVLEIGTGCGYQAAVLAELAFRVFTVETFEELALTAAARLARLGYRNVEVRHGEGYEGWPEEAPFDAIIVTAAPTAVPPALLDQLAPGGRMVVPVGEPGATQILTLCRKDAAGHIDRDGLLPVSFVPMLRRDHRR
ncbi:MAG: protein-L-isoaspartate(D-aspartate) O-methyltransferase [Rhodospirillales bacterium]|nr:protein-L-isoaspartate(D-aspartate) O-methyltransferase [Rhodospirillales bacterium]